MEVQWTSMPPNGRAADRRAPGACARRVRRAPIPARSAVGSRCQWQRERAHRDVRPGLSRGAGGVAGKVAPSGGPFFWSLFFGQTKKSDPGCRGRSHPHIAFHRRRRRHKRSSGGLRQKTPNPPYINIDLRGPATHQYTRPQAARPKIRLSLQLLIKCTLK
jgi:hypothetical protein